MKTVTAVTGRLAAVLALSCGDNDIMPVDAGRDARIDAPSYPPAPALGTQIDRMGRPVINTALNAAFLDMSAAAGPKKDTYNAVSNPAMFATAPVMTGRTIAAELAVNLAIIDVLDQGDPNVADPDGCGNQLLHNGLVQGGAPPMALSYQTLALILADDMLYVDTDKPSCLTYLSLELEAAGIGTHTSCGGRRPTHDVIDTSYSVLAAGVNGFGPGFTPRYGDGVPPHADVNDNAFPYFGAPH